MSLFLNTNIQCTIYNCNIQWSRGNLSTSISAGISSDPEAYPTLAIPIALEFHRQ